MKWAMDKERREAEEEASGPKLYNAPSHCFSDHRKRNPSKVKPPGKDVKAKVVKLASGRCEVCGFKQPTAFKYALLMVHHIRPSAYKGPSVPENLAYLCVMCHEIADYICAGHNWYFSTMPREEMIQRVLDIIRTFDHGDARPLFDFPSPVIKRIESARSLQEQAQAYQSALDNLVSAMDATLGRQKTVILLRKTAKTLDSAPL